MKKNEKEEEKESRMQGVPALVSRACRVTISTSFGPRSDAFRCDFSYFILIYQEIEEILFRMASDSKLLEAYVPDGGLHRDQAGGGPRARLSHCTSA